jgi:Zn-dependent peptidase ImmA (M78 family)
MRSSKIELYKFVNGLREFLDIGYDAFPVNSIDICGNYSNVEIKYHRFKTNGFCAAILLGEKADTIILNSNRQSAEQNFDCSHEIIHAAKHRNLGINTFSCMELKAKQQSNLGYWEWEANEGAAEFLVPYFSILPEIKKAYPSLKTWHDFHLFKNDMAEKYDVTEAVINFRLESLKYEICQYLDGVEICSLDILSNKQQINRGIKCKSLNDMEGELLKKECKALKKTRRYPLNLNCIDIMK